jgi:hypothetical protein
MRRMFLSLVLIASGGLAHADECDEKIRQIVLQTGTQFMSRAGPGGWRVELQHPLFKYLDLYCYRTGLFGVSAHTDNAFPSAGQLNVFATVGEVTSGAKAVGIRAALEECHRTALADTRNKEIQIKDARVSCIVTRDTVQGSFFLVFTPR